MNQSQRAIKHLYDKGYRVTEEGKFINPKGVELKIKLKSKHKYPQSQVWFEGKAVNYHIHRLAAYCIFGDEMFKKGICVRHLDGDTLNVKHDNIALGTYSENERDKPEEVRKLNASNANKCRKDVRRLSMRRFSDEEIKDIRERSSRGEKGIKIAKDYKVVKDTIYQILRGETYKDVI